MVASTTIGYAVCPTCSGSRSIFPWLAAALLFVATPASVCAETATEAADPFETVAQQEQVSEATIESATASADPFEAEPAVYDPFVLTAPLDAAAYTSASPTPGPQYEVVYLQPPPNEAGAANGTYGVPGVPDGKSQATTDPCAGAADKPLSELGINIVLPGGLLPKDYAALCWAERNAMGGPFAAMRCWPVLPYFWDAPCLCYRPLYFEEINLERHGYGCCACIQPAVSAAHFFGTIPALPYCMAEHCPCECEYTLGHYRPGSCPPWRYHWPSCRPIAAAAEAGVLTGLIIAIP